MTNSKVITMENSTKAERLDIYCQGLANGLSKVDAYVAAGYSDTKSAHRNAFMFHRNNAAYITAYLSEHIGSHAPTALKVILTIMNDPREKGGIRLKAAQDVLDRAGFSAKQKIEVNMKDAKEMSTEELQNELRKAFEDHSELAQILAFQPRTSTNTGEDEGRTGTEVV